MKNVRRFSFLSAAALLALASPVRAAEESPFKFEFHGFVVGSMYYQNEVFASGQGQGLTVAAPAVELSDSLFSGDVRETRFSFGVTGPSVLGGTPRGYIEMDFFGTPNNASFAADSALPRLRVAIAELKLGNTVVQVGQQNQLVVPQIPATLGHVGSPVTYGAGSIGWRTPGIRVAHTVPAGSAKVELAAEVVKNKWADPATGNTAANIGAGEAGLPMVQLRVKADGKAGSVGYSAYVVGVFSRADLAGFNDVATLPAAAGGDSEVDTYVGEVGGRLAVGGLTLAANAYYGQATGPLIGTIIQFGDIKDIGAWFNAGYNITKELSVWGLYGLARPDEDDVRKWAGDTGSKLKNDLYGGMIRYAKGGYQVGVEAYQYNTTYATGPTTDTETQALQVIGSVGYFF